VTSDGLTSGEEPKDSRGLSRSDRKLAVLLAMAMFVLVVDTSFMNVSISAVASDIDTTVSGVQTAIALEALVSAAFILISSKVADLIGRKRAYTIGLLGYLIGAIAMTVAQTLTVVVVFWAVIGGLGASLLLPAMQSLIHGNFEGRARTQAYALVGAAAAIAAGLGPLLGGFITTFMSWRVGFLLEAVIIVVVLVGVRLVKDVPYTGDRAIDGVGAVLSVVGMGGVVLSILVWQEGGEAVGLLLVVGVFGLAGLTRWLTARAKAGRPTLIDPQLFRSPYFRLGISSQMLQQIAIGGTMIVIPLFLQIALEYDALQAGLSIAPLSLSMFAVALLAGKRAGRRRPSVIVRAGFGLTTLGLLLVVPLVPRTESGLALLVPLVIAGIGLGLLVSQLNNYTLAPVPEEHASEAAGVNSGAGSFGLSFGLAMAGGIMLASLAAFLGAFTDASDVIPADEKPAISTALEENAEVVSDTQLADLVEDQPPEIEAEIIAINDDARARSLQVAMLVPVLASLVGLVLSFRMVKLPDLDPKPTPEGLDLA
jgi:MFS family permease